VKINWNSINWNTVAVGMHDRVKIKSDAGTYEIWGIDWLWQKIMVRRACGDGWVPFDKIEWIEQGE
jgi:hypothetical protein